MIVQSMKPKGILITSENSSTKSRKNNTRKFLEFSRNFLIFQLKRDKFITNLSIYKNYF